MLDKYLEEWPLYQEIFEKGFQLGLQKSKLEGLRPIIMLFVKKRFPALADEAEVHLDEMVDLTRLQMMMDEIPYVPDEAAARALLGLPA